MSIDAIGNFKLSVNDKGGVNNRKNSTNLNVNFKCLSKIKIKIKGVTQLRTTIIIYGLFFYYYPHLFLC